QARLALESAGRVFGRTFEIVEGDIGGVAIAKHDTPLPQQTIDLAKSAGAVLLGAVGDRRYDSMPRARKPERGLLQIREILGNYANLRPVYVYEPLAGSSTIRPEVARGVDLIFVRELLGGIYFGTPRFREGNRAVDTEVYTVEEVQRVARSAFNLARSRRKRVTSVDKANVLETSILWREVTGEIAKEFPDVEFENLYVDNCAMQIILKPKHFDVVLTNNLFGDILSDEAAVLAGSLGMLPSASVGAAVGLYEPVHGSAPDIAGTGKANPIGAIASVGMMLEHSFGMPEAAARVQAAITRTLNEGYRTADIYAGDAAGCKLVNTTEMGRKICSLIEG
ncbi:MAG TPA: 3-isopropylmalate dehydrogenase, partial [Terriglobia bacterium]|nr:3-isopropylmalate dehydrogenase [Terriglobia bacterium]